MFDSQFLSQLVARDGPLLANFLILLLVVPLATLFPLSRDMQPLAWFGTLARELGNKVNHPKRGPRQQLIAGIMASGLLVLPFWLLIVLLLELAEFPWFFEILILYFCLSDADFNQVAPQVRDALDRGDKDRSRQLLSVYLSRDTTELSEVGLAKACIEKLITVPIYGIAATVFLYAIAGAPLVLLARMLKQLELMWPPLAPQFRHFVAPVRLLLAILLYVPAWLWGLSLAMAGGPAGFRALLPRSCNQEQVSSGRCLSVAAATLGTELGGPLKYRGVKVSTQRIGQGPLPDAGKVELAIRLTRSAGLIWYSCLLILPLLWVLLRYVNPQ